MSNCVMPFFNKSTIYLQEGMIIYKSFVHDKYEYVRAYNTIEKTVSYERHTNSRGLEYITKRKYMFNLHDYAFKYFESKMEMFREAYKKKEAHEEMLVWQEKTKGFFHQTYWETISEKEYNKLKKEDEIYVYYLLKEKQYKKLINVILDARTGKEKLIKTITKNDYENFDFVEFVEDYKKKEKNDLPIN